MKKINLITLFLCTIPHLMIGSHYVSPWGNDSNDGLSWTTAQATIQHAINTSTAGDTVFLAGGKYNQSFTLANGIHVFGGYDIQTGIRDNNLHPSIIDGKGLSNTIISSHSGYTQTTIVDGLTIENANHTRNGGGAHLHTNCVLQNCTIRYCSTTSNGGGVYNNGGLVSNCLIELCEAINAGGAVHNRGGITENCIIRGCKGKYASIRNEENAIVRNCLLHNNEPLTTAWPNSGGIYNVSGVVHNCTMVCNYGSQYAGIHSDNIAYNNVCWNNLSEEGFVDPANYIAGDSHKFGSGDNAGDDYFETINFTVTLSPDNCAPNGPHFLAPSTFVGAPKNAAEIAAMRAADFSLTAQSPLIDKGRMIEHLTYDIEHTQRPIGNGIDIGCYEFNPNTPITPVAGIKLNMDTIYVYTDDTVLVTAILFPSKATNRTTRWTTSDTTIAIATNGLIRGQKVGQTIVRAITQEGNHSAEAVVNVTTKPVVITHQEVLTADSLYHIENYTIPSFIPFLIAKESARADSTDANLIAMRTRIAELQSYKEPYNVVVNINGDPSTRMAFSWFTNERMTNGMVQLIAKDRTKVTEKDFAKGITITATSTLTKPLHYATSLSGIIKKAKIPAKQKFRYVSHKAIAEGLKPNTTYTYRVGTEGHWSQMGTFKTAPARSDEFTFIYMTDSHIQDPEYVNHTKWCATAAVLNSPDAQFCVFPGDFVETGTSQNSEWEWERWFEESMRPIIYQMPIVPTDGNHDDSNNLNYSYHFNTDNQFKEQAQIKPQFDGTTYSFMYGDVLFLVYSKQDYWTGTYSHTNLTSTYLTDDLGNWFRTQVAAHPEAKWRIALVHKNVFSGSGHQQDEETPLFRATMLPIFKECEIDLVLQGHDHCYEVIGPVNPDTQTPILTDITDVEDVPIDSIMNITGKKGGIYTVDNGTMYFVGATCGKKQYNPYSKQIMEANFHKHQVRNYFDLFTGMLGQPGAPSYTAFTVNEHTIKVNSYTTDQHGNSTLFNSFTIQRTTPHHTIAIE